MKFDYETVHAVLKKFNSIQQDKTGVNARLRASKDSNRIAIECMLESADTLSEVFNFFREVDFLCGTEFEDYCLEFEDWKNNNTDNNECKSENINPEPAQSSSDIERYLNILVQSQIDMSKKLESLTGTMTDVVKALKPERKNVILSVNNIPKIEGEIIHPQFGKILGMISNKIAPYLVGEAGTGKSHIIEQIAKALNLDYHFTHCITNEFQLTGFIDANGDYQETEFYKAYKNGGIFLLDEMDASVPEALLILNNALSSKYFDFPCGVVEKHPDFRVVATGNTIGKGGTDNYTGRSHLDAASLNRFMPIMVDYSVEIEMAVSGNNQELIDFVHELRKSCKLQGSDILVTYRDIERLTILEPCWDDLNDLLNCQFFLGHSEDEKMLIKNSMDYSKMSGNKYYNSL